MPESLWTLENVTLAGGRRPRLEGVSVRIARGITAVLGPSGAGKTSLLNLLVAFERPGSGSVWREFEAGTHTLPVYWVPQSGGLWSHLTAAEHIAKVLPASRGVFAVPRPASGSGKGPMDLLALFDLADKAASFPDELSQGERARLSVARALAADAAVLVMDEPLAHVDTTQAARFWEVIRSHVRERQTSLVFATHSPRTVLAEAGRVVCLRDGRVTYDGNVDDLYRRPPTRELAECLGEVNWFEPADARFWLGVETPNPLAVRPEQLTIAPSANGGLRVRDAQFKGDVAEAQIEHAATGAVTRVYHRPSTGALKPGQSVVLKLLLLLAAVILAGCGGGDGPALPVRGEWHWPTPPDGATVPAARSLAVGSKGEIVCVDTRGRVLVFGDAGTLLREWRMPDTSVGKPEGVAVLKDGRIAVSDTHYHRIVFFDSQGRVVGMLGKEGTGPGEFIYPVGITQDDDGFIYVCEYGSNDRVQKFTADGKFVLSFGSFGTGPGQFQRPSGLAVRRGKVYVADAINNRILVFGSDGKFYGELRGPGGPPDLRFPYDLEFGPDGVLYVVEYASSRVTALSLDGRVLGRYGAPGDGERQFRTPWGMTIDSKGRIFVADTGNHRIVELDL